MIRPRKTRAPHPQPILVLREKLEQSWWFSEIVREMRVVVEVLTNFSPPATNLSECKETGSSKVAPICPNSISVT